MDEQKVEGGRIAAVPSFALEQAFLQKCAECAFNRLDEQKSLHGQVCGLPSVATDPSPQLHKPCCHSIFQKLVPTLFATTKAGVTQALKFTFFSFLPFTWTLPYQKVGYFSVVFSFVWFFFLFFSFLF